MTDELVSKTAVIQALDRAHGGAGINENLEFYDAGLDMAKWIVASLRPKEGVWITRLYSFGRDRYECDDCHNRADIQYPFCPYCGLRMTGNIEKE